MVDLGGGVALDENWDFSVNGRGDLSQVTGINELEKDIAFNVARSLQRVLGDRTANYTEKRIEVNTSTALNDDPRIDRVTTLSAREVRNDPNKYEVVADVETAEGPFELVFEVSV